MTRHKNPRSAATTRARTVRGNGRGGTLIGVFIGLVLGLGLAAGVAYYLMRANGPFPTMGGKETREALRDAVKGGKAEALASEKPRFDFYKILPGGEEPKVLVERKVAPDRALMDQAKDRDAERVPAKAPAAESATKAATAEPATKVAAAEPAAKAVKAAERYWLQAGSFAAEGDAENLKAQLALAGWEAGVQQGTLPDKGVRYRVRLGPYDNTDELNRIKSELTRKGFDAAVIKF